MSIIKNIFKKKVVEGKAEQRKVEQAKKTAVAKPAKKEPVKSVKKVVKKKPTVVKTVKKKQQSVEQASQIIVKPLITEKATDLSAQNKYVFAVSVKANKIMIAEAISDLYKVKPIAVNIINSSGKRVRYGRIRGKQKNWKKAIITLRQGESIKVHDI